VLAVVSTLFSETNTLDKYRELVSWVFLHVCSFAHDFAQVCAEKTTVLEGICIIFS